MTGNMFMPCRQFLLFLKGLIKGFFFYSSVFIVNMWLSPWRPPGSTLWPCLSLFFIIIIIYLSHNNKWNSVCVNVEYVQNKSCSWELLLLCVVFLVLGICIYAHSILWRIQTKSVATVLWLTAVVIVRLWLNQAFSILLLPHDGNTSHCLLNAC